MEKKKLKKLQINKMSGFLVISEQEQMMMKGGNLLWQIIKRVLKPLEAGRGSDYVPKGELYDRLYESYGIDTELSDAEIDSIIDSWGITPDDFYTAVSDNA